MKIPIEKIDSIEAISGNLTFKGEYGRFDIQETQFGPAIVHTREMETDGEFIVDYIFIDKIAVITIREEVVND